LVTLGVVEIAKLSAMVDNRTRSSESGGTEPCHGAAASSLRADLLLNWILGHEFPTWACLDVRVGK